MRQPRNIAKPYGSSPTSPKPISNLGNALERQGRLDAAVAEHREAIRLKPEEARNHANLGLALQSKCEFASAVEELRKARDLARADLQLA